MEENLNTEQSSPANSTDQWYHTLWGRITIAVLVLTVIYVGFTRIKSSYLDRQQVTNPTTLHANESKENPDGQGIDENNENLDGSDSTHVAGKNILPDSIQVNKDSNHVDLFKVNTSFEKISVEPAGGIFASKKSELRNTSNDLFDVLLIPNEDRKDFNTKMFDQYYLTDFISLKSTLKIIGIAGKQLLLGMNTADNESVLQAISASGKVRNLIIVDNRGGIKYASDQKVMNSNIREVIPDVSLDNSSLSWYENENNQVITFPLFHTYGKLGMAILIMNSDQ